MIYLYHTTTYYDTTNVLGVDPEVEAANNADWEANGEPYDLEVSEVNIQQDYVQIDVDWPTFKSYITGQNGYTWANVFYTENSKSHEIYFVSETKL